VRQKPTRKHLGLAVLLRCLCSSCTKDGGQGEAVAGIVDAIRMRDLVLRQDRTVLHFDRREAEVVEVLEG